MTDLDQILGRDGHLHDLAVDRSITGDLPFTLQAALDDHLAACEPCTERVADARRFVDAPLPPLRANRSGSPPPSPPDGGVVIELRPRRAPWLAVGLALAAAFLLFVRAPDDGWISRGSGLDLEVWRSDGNSAEQLVTGDTVSPGDRLGFRVQANHAGYLLVIGFDSTGLAYPCFPQGDSPSSVAFGPTLEPQQLDAAIALDATPGTERIVAVLCDDPVQFPTVASAVTSEGPPGCQRSEIRLVKGP